MTRILRVLAVVCLAVPAVPAAAQTEVTDQFSRTVHLDQNGTFDLTNIAGNIVLTGGSGRDITIDAVKRVQRPNPNAARAQLQMIDIQVIEQANRVEVRVAYPRPRNFPGSVDFTIALPEDADVTLRTLTGDVRATNVKGELRAETITGSVTAAAARKLAALKCVSGNIEILDSAAEDLVTAQTVSGNVTVRGLKARAIEVGSVSGNVRVEDTQADRMMVKSVNGSVDYVGDLARNGRYQFTSHSGDIRLMLSDSTGFELLANTFSGTVRSDFAVTRRGRAGGEGQGVVRSPRAIRGAFGDASAMLALRTFSGNISVTRR